MSNKRYEPEIPPGTHLDRSADSDGAYRGTLRDNATNRLVGHANWREVDDDEEEDVDEGDETDGVLLVVAVGLAGLAAGAAASRVRETRRRRRGERQTSDAAPAAAEPFAEANKRSLPPADWYEDAAGRLRWWDGQQWTEHVKRPDHGELATHVRASDQQQVQTSIGPADPHGQTSVAMSSAEWRDRARAMLLARAFSEEQWKLLSNARIEDGDAEVLASQRELKGLTPQQFSDRMNALLEQHPNLFSEPLMLAPAGWYEDGSGNSRWWDGRVWTGHTQRALVSAPRSTAASTSAAPGWYDDGSGRQRWWTGQNWA